MIYIGVGVLGFIAMNIFDLVSLKKVPFGIKPLLWTAGCGMLLYAILMLCFESNTLPLDGWMVWAGWGLLAVSLFMIMLALFINLPFRKTYVEAGVSNRLVKTGLYALVRHPGVYWVATFMFSFVLISRSSMMLIGAPVFVFLNTAFVVIEDKCFFIKMFEGYSEYQKETPMLIPNRRSIKAFLQSIKRRGSVTGT
jgi:protein-S-isoprenylcysteine O-methyltransferase Ste14